MYLHAILFFGGNYQLSWLQFRSPNLGEKHVQTNFKRSFEHVKTAAAQKATAANITKKTYFASIQVWENRVCLIRSHSRKKIFFVPRQNPYWVSLSARLFFYSGKGKKGFGCAYELRGGGILIKILIMLGKEAQCE